MIHRFHDAQRESLIGLQGEAGEISTERPDSPIRTYTHSSTQSLRDNIPEAGILNYSEAPGQMRVRSGSLMFDALFALAMHEYRQNCVEEITDKFFNHGQPLPCHGFETGARWHYIWTRDTAYAVDLALALVDPVRSLNSLSFKLSERRVPANERICGGPEIVQDTGSGGSWPISTDRVVWALAAYELLKYLDGEERAAFLQGAYAAIVTTIENDRNAVYDPRDGLYRGEQSFLDWREQSYPSWTKDDVVHIGMSKSLSTNVAYYAILDIASQLAEELTDPDRGRCYREWAEHLKQAINRKFWLEEHGLYSSITGAEPDLGPLHRFDMLGEALVILLGIADERQTASILANYPHTNAGVPVFWPQQPDAPVYHNRAIWPFVSAYCLRAARKGRNEKVIDHNVESLMRAAALNISNMENLECVTGLPALFDRDYPELFGPVVNSQRQLWSVAGYLSMVLDLIFGRETTQRGIRFQPFITKQMRNGRFQKSDRLLLRNLPYKGRLIDVTIELPAVDALSEGFYDTASVTLNGKTVEPETFFTTAELAPHNQFVITLKESGEAPSSMRLLTVDDAADLSNQALFAPREPNFTAIREEHGLLTLEFDANGEPGVCFNIYRNGRQIASKLCETRWTDPDSGNFASQALCYAIESEFLSSGNRSHHSKPLCRWPEGAVQKIAVTDARISCDPVRSLTDEYGRIHLKDWGYPDDMLELRDFAPVQGGICQIGFVYANAAGTIETGVTAAVKWIEVVDTASGNVVGSGTVFMPHLPSWDVWKESSQLSVSLKAGTSYNVRVRDFYNMSYLAHFSLYTHGKGGAEGPYNRFNLASIILRSTGVQRSVKGKLVGCPAAE